MTHWNDSRFRSRAVNISSNQAVLLAAILALWWISWRYDSYNMTHNGEYQGELTLNELELKILTEVNFRKRLEHFQQHCDPYRNWKLENLNRDFFPLRHHFQVGLSTSDQRQIQERLKLFFWNERYRFKLSRASLDGFGQPGTQFVLDPLKDAYFKPLTFWIKLFFCDFYMHWFCFISKKILSKMHLDTTLKESFRVMGFGGIRSKLYQETHELLCSGSPD